MSLNPHTLEQLSAYVDGELTGPDREAVERALASDSRLRDVERALRSFGMAVRQLSEAEVARADFSGLADRVLRSGSRPGWLVGLRQLWQRPLFGAGALVAVAAAAFFALRPAVPAGPAGVVVQSVSADPSGELRPVVHRTETGDAIIWLVDSPDASGNHRPAPLPPDKPRTGVQAPVPNQNQQRPHAGEL